MAIRIIENSSRYRPRWTALADLLNLEYGKVAADWGTILRMGLQWPHLWYSYILKMLIFFVKIIIYIWIKKKCC